MGQGRVVPAEVVQRAGERMAGLRPGGIEGMGAFEAGKRVARSSRQRQGTAGGVVINHLLGAEGIALFREGERRVPADVG